MLPDDDFLATVDVDALNGMLHSLALEVVVVVVGRQSGDVVDTRRIDSHELADLQEHALASLGEIIGEQPLSLCHIVLIDGIEFSDALPLVHIAPVVAPSCRLVVESE